ncbi:MAG: glycosyltransferase, partial [Panacibacter sp.]
MKPRLLIVLNRLVVGGQSIDTVPLANALKQDYEIMIVHGEKENDEEAYTGVLQNCSGIAFTKISSLKRSVNPLNDIGSLFSMYRVIKKFAPSIVHTHGSKPGFIGRIAAWFARVPVIIHTFHGHLFHSYYNKIGSFIIIRFERLLGRISTKVVVLSNHQKAEIAEQYKIVNAAKTVTVPLGIDEHEYSENAGLLRRNMRSEYQLKDECVAICIIGRMVPVKNYQLFVEIIIALYPLQKNAVKFFFIGDGDLKNELQQQLNNAGIEWSEALNNPAAKVIFTSWVTPVTSVLHGMDIVVLTSLNEGTPLSIIEAQACGKPVIATNTGGVRDTF